jgi:uncharacterized membrane protein YphA (DoxX/SURF4 family)
MATARLDSRAARVLILLGRVALGVIFLYAAYTKLRLPWAIFAMSINSYQVLPEPLVIFIARVLPWLELALGVLLIAGWKLRYVAAATSALLLGFFVLMVRSYFKGLGIDCGCFGVGEALSVGTLTRDGVLVILSIVLTVAAFQRHRNSKLEVRNSPS